MVMINQLQKPWPLIWLEHKFHFNISLERCKHALITFSNNNIILLATTIKHVLTDLRFRKIKRTQNPAPVCFQKQLPGSCLLPEAANFIKKETLAQVFSREFCEISKNTFFYRTEHLWWLLLKFARFWIFSFLFISENCFLNK